MTKDIEKQLSQYFKDFKLQKFKKGELIYQPGDEINDVGFVKSGYVRLYTISKDGQEFTINIFKPVFYLSLIYALGKGDNPYYFEAITPVELYKAPKEEVLKYIKNNPELTFDLMTNILDGFREMLINSQYLAYGNAYSRIASIIMSLANNYGTKDGNKVKLNFATTHRVIASLTGTARETATIQILKLKEKGIIESRGSHMVIEDMDRLKQETEV
jgi:CRP-like cAMP-binding protein